MGQGKVQGRNIERTTFADLAQMVESHYRVKGNKSMDRMKRALAALRKELGLMRAIDIGYDRLNAYAAKRLDHGIAHATVAYELAVLRHAFRVAKSAGRALPPNFPKSMFRMLAAVSLSAMNLLLFAIICPSSCSRSSHSPI